MVEPILNSEQIARFDADGFLVVDGLFSAAEVERVLQIAHLDPQLKAADTKSDDEVEAEGVGGGLAYRPTLSEDAYSYMARSRRVVEPMEQLLRDQVAHFYHLIMQKDPGTGGWQYHQDYGYHYKEFLFPDYVSFMIALEPAVAANGCIRGVSRLEPVGAAGAPVFGVAIDCRTDAPGPGGPAFRGSALRVAGGLGVVLPRQYAARFGGQ